MITNQRVIFSDDGTLTDLSYELSNFRSSAPVIPFVAAEDFIYIGSELPFNNKYFDVSVVNDQAASITIEIWFGNAWVSAVDIINTTSASGVPLANDGHVIFNTNILKGWDIERESKDVTGLTGTVIYNMYWTRIGFSADLAVALALNYIGQKFAEDDLMYDYYPDLNNSDFKSAFASGKTTWDTQHFLAANNIIRDLKRQNIILTRDQLLDHQLFEDAAVHKCASIIYGGLGKSYVDNLTASRSAYKSAMKIGPVRKDMNADGRTQNTEKKQTEGWLSR